MNAARAQRLAVRLHRGGVDQLDQVMLIMERAFNPCFGEAWTRSQCAGILPMAGVTLTIAEDDRGPIGFSLARAVADEAELLLIAVDPASQGNGAGRCLLDHFIASARDAGAHKLHLEMRDGNRAGSLYRSAGFAPAGRRRGYYKGPDGEHHDAITLMLTSSN
ncbi:MAG TPA: GNAT family N-acetyltransferase [Sphingomicrobium sp.]|nr:GNAT family N-acetyltransferase [Sphingomicrobium sp.]